jgi:hypothetical protein
VSEPRHRTSCRTSAAARTGRRAGRAYTASPPGCAPTAWRRRPSSPRSRRPCAAPSRGGRAATRRGAPRRCRTARSAASSCAAGGWRMGRGGWCHNAAGPRLQAARFPCRRFPNPPQPPPPPSRPFPPANPPQERERAVAAEALRRRQVPRRGVVLHMVHHAVVEAVGAAGQAVEGGQQVRRRPVERLEGWERMIGSARGFERGRRQGCRRAGARLGGRDGRGGRAARGGPPRRHSRRCSVKCSVSMKRCGRRGAAEGGKGHARVGAGRAQVARQRGDACGAARAFLTPPARRARPAAARPGRPWACRRALLRRPHLQEHGVVH